MANIKNPFSKKNTFWYNKFAYLINGIKEYVAETAGIFEKYFSIDSDEDANIISANNNKDVVISGESMVLLKNQNTLATAYIGVSGNEFVFGANDDEEVTLTLQKIDDINNRMVIAVTLTQAEYDALTTKDPYTLYIISDAQ